MKRAEEFPEILKDDLQAWTKKGQEPFSLDSVLWNRQQEEIKRQEREAREQIPKLDPNEETDTQKIAARHGIKLYLKYLKPSLMSQVTQFCEKEDAFMRFKQSSTLDRTMKQYNKGIEYAEQQKRLARKLNKIREKSTKLLAVKVPSPTRPPQGRNRDTVSPLPRYNSVIIVNEAKE